MCKISFQINKQITEWISAQNKRTARSSESPCSGEENTVDSTKCRERNTDWHDPSHETIHTLSKRLQHDTQHMTHSKKCLSCYRVSEWVQARFDYAPPNDTDRVISKEASLHSQSHDRNSCNMLNCTSQLQTLTTYHIKHNKLPWFWRLLWHSARKRNLSTSGDEKQGAFLFCSEFRCWRNATLPSFYLTPCQPLTDDLYTRYISILKLLWEQI